MLLTEAWSCKVAASRSIDLRAQGHRAAHSQSLVYGEVRFHLASLDQGSTELLMEALVNLNCHVMISSIYLWSHGSDFWILILNFEVFLTDFLRLLKWLKLCQLFQKKRFKKNQNKQKQKNKQTHSMHMCSTSWPRCYSLQSHTDLYQLRIWP